MTPFERFIQDALKDFEKHLQSEGMTANTITDRMKGRVSLPATSSADHTAKTKSRKERSRGGRSWSMPYTKAVLTFIAVALAVLVIRPVFEATPASAQGGCGGNAMRPCYVTWDLPLEVRVSNQPSPTVVQWVKFPRKTCPSLSAV